MGLRIQLDGKPLLDVDDSSIYHVDNGQCLIYRFLPHLLESGSFVSNGYARMGPGPESLPSAGNRD